MGERPYFNSRPSARGDRQSASSCATSVIFQFTPLREGRLFPSRNRPRLFISIHAPPRGATTAIPYADAPRYIFQFTPLREGRQIVSAFSQSCLLFQFTPLREGRPLLSLPRFPPRYFNSRPSARGDESHKRQENDTPISIHAPPRGATHGKGGDATRHAISIHAPPRGATEGPTHWFKRELISIHAPPRGAT